MSQTSLTINRMEKKNFIHSSLGSKPAVHGACFNICNSTFVGRTSGYAASESSLQRLPNRTVEPSDGHIAFENRDISARNWASLIERQRLRNCAGREAGGTGR